MRVNGQLVSYGPFKPLYVAELIQRNKTDSIKVSADEMGEKFLQRLSRLHKSHGYGHLN